MTETSTSARVRIAAFAAGAAVVAAAGTAAALHRDDKPAPRAAAHPTDAAADQFAGLNPTPPGQPCPGATLTNTLTKLLTAATTPIYAPLGKVPTNTWICGGNPALAYGNIEVDFEGGWSDVDAQAKWRGLAAENGGDVQTIAGQPAWVRPGDADTWPSVDFVINGTHVTVIAPSDVATSDVVALAKTIPTVPSLPTP